MNTDHISPGVIDGEQLNIAGGFNKAFVISKDAHRFTDYRCKVGLALTYISKITGVAVDVLNKIERGELIASSYWWNVFRESINKGMEKLDGSENYVRCGESEEQTSFDFEKSSGS